MYTRRTWRATRTVWFEAKVIGHKLLDAPPNFSKSPKLLVGHIFYHCTPTQYQLWLWTMDPSGVKSWKPVHHGFIRADGRVLTVTESLKVPSWVKASTYAKL